MLRPSLIMVWMAGTPSLVAGTFTNRLGCVMRSCSVAGRVDGAVRVVGQRGGDLEGDKAVLAVARVVERPQKRQRVLDVGDGQLP